MDSRKTNRFTKRRGEATKAQPNASTSYIRQTRSNTNGRQLANIPLPVVRRAARQQQQQDNNPFLNEERSLEMLPERIFNRRANRDYAQVYVSKSRRKERQRKFRKKKKTCKQKAILLDDEKLCDPVVIPVFQDKVDGDYIVLGTKRIRLKNKYLRGRYRNLQNKTLVEIISGPIVRRGPLQELTDQNTSAREISNLISSAASNQVSQQEQEELTQPQEQEQEELTQPQEQEQEQEQIGTMKDKLLYTYKQLPNNDVNIYINGELQFLVRDSAFLDAIGIPNQKGLYTAKPRRKDDILGRYSGKLIGLEIDSTTKQKMDNLRDPRYLLSIESGNHAKTKYVIDGAQPLQSAKEQTRLLHPYNKKLKDGREEIIDPLPLETEKYPYPGICAPFINDAAGPKKVKGTENNVSFRPSGFVVALRKIPAFDSEKSIEENKKAELLVSYGEDYWTELNDEEIERPSVNFCRNFNQSIGVKDLYQAKKQTSKRLDKY